MLKEAHGVADIAFWEDMLLDDGVHLVDNCQKEVALLQDAAKTLGVPDFAQDLERCCLEAQTVH